MVDFRSLKGLEAPISERTPIADLKEARGSRDPLFIPGNMVLSLPPVEVLGNVFEIINSDGKPPQLSAVFQGDAALVVAQPLGFKGHTYRTRISTMTRNIAKRGDPEALTSDMDLLLKGLGYSGQIKTLSDYAAALVSFGGKSFAATNEWRARCDKKRTRWVDDGEGATVEDPSGQFGCGESYYMSQIPRLPDGTYAERFGCAKCGAQLMAFQQLGRFRKVA